MCMDFATYPFVPSSNQVMYGRVDEVAVLGVDLAS